MFVQNGENIPLFLRMQWGIPGAEMEQPKRCADARDALCHERPNFENYIFPGRGKAV